jgi:hypothetical protein
VTHLIALLGGAGTGKSTVAGFLETHYGAKRYSFANLLKQIAMRTLDFTHEQCYGTQEQKETIDPRYGFHPRWFLQRLGTEGIRNTLGQDFWIRATLAQIQIDAPDLAVIDDCRFINEARAIRQCGGHVWRLVAPGGGISQADVTHGSEAEIALAHDPAVDDTIAPAVRGLDELYECVRILAMLRELGAPK